MRGNRADPFGGGGETPASPTETPLPERGTGLETGAAGERRGGNQRSEQEREVRHREIVDDSTNSGEFVRTVENGMVVMRKKGFEGEKSTKSTKSLTQTWVDHRANKKRT